MALASITCYFNTGFGGMDIPKTPSVLELATKKQYPDFYYKREDIDTPSIIIKDSYENLCNVDYVKIHNNTTGKNSFYFAVPLSAAKNTTILSLSLDALTTMGGASNLDYISGWQTRGHISKNEDTLFDNISDEDFTPRKPLIVRNYVENLVGADVEDPDANLKDTRLITSNVDLDKFINIGDNNRIDVISGVLNASEGQTEDALMYFPKIELEKDSTRFQMAYDNSSGTTPTTFASYNINNLSAYNADDADVQKAMAYLLSCGQLELQNSYVIPKEWMPDSITSKNDENRKFTQIKGCWKNKVLTDINYELNIGNYNIKNKKCNSYLRRLNIANVASGDSVERSIYELKDPSKSDTHPKLILWADPSPNGKPYARFEYVSDNKQLFQSCAKGTQWITNQLAFNDSAGSLWNQISYNINRSTLESREFWNRAEAAMGYVDKFASIITPSDKNNGAEDIGMWHQGLSTTGQAISAVNNALMNEANRLQKVEQIQREKAANQIDYARTTRIQPPNVSFTPEPSLNLYGYNYFVVSEITMSDEDIIELDRYFQRFGYSGLHRPLNASVFNCRQYYTYVQAYDINIKSEYGLRIRQSAIRQLNGGVRTWSVLPDSSYYDLN